MKFLILTAFIFTISNTYGQVFPRNVRKAERNYSIVAQRAIAKAKKTIEVSKQNLINELKKEANKAIKDAKIKYADNILDRIKELKARDKVDDFFGKPLNHKNNFSVVIENVCPCSAVELMDMAEPWTNRNYKFINVPKKLLGKKFFPYKARSKIGATLIIKKNCLIRVLVSGNKGDLPAVAMWEKEGWKRGSAYNLRTNDRGKAKFIILSRLAKAGAKIRMNDYSGGIIVIAN